MKKLFRLIIAALSVLCVNVPTKVEAGNAQQLYTELCSFTTTIGKMNTLLAGIHDTTTADAAAKPLKELALQFFRQAQTISEIEADDSMDAATEQKLGAQIRQLQQDKTTFQKECARIGNAACYGSEALRETFFFIGSMGEQ